MKSFTPTYFRSNQSNVFNAVQADGVASIVGKSRPDMVVSLKCDYDAMIEKVKQLTELVKNLEVKLAEAIKLKELALEGVEHYEYECEKLDGIICKKYLTYEEAHGRAIEINSNRPCNF